MTTQEQLEDDNCLLHVINQKPFYGHCVTHPDHKSYRPFLRLIQRGLLTLCVSGDRMEVRCRNNPQG